MTPKELAAVSLICSALARPKAFPAGSFQDFCQFVCVDGQDLLRRGTVEQQFGGGQAEDVGESVSYLERPDLTGR